MTEFSSGDQELGNTDLLAWIVGVIEGECPSVSAISDARSRLRYHVLRRGSRSKQRHKRAPATNLN
jgi:hypothetical protein